MKWLICFAALLAVCCAGKVKRDAQNPKVWSALDQLRGKARLSIEDITNLIVSAKAGEDYPNLAAIPESHFDCASVKQPGFYADVDSRCQVIRRCDINGNQSAYLCPNMTIFNQITLVCHWFWDVDCSQAKTFYDYSNSRLYQNVPLLDDEPDYVVAQAVGAVAPVRAAKPAKAAAKPAAKPAAPAEAEKAAAPVAEAAAPTEAPAEAE